MGPRIESSAKTSVCFGGLRDMQISFVSLHLLLYTWFPVLSVSDLFLSLDDLTLFSSFFNLRPTVSSTNFYSSRRSGVPSYGSCGALTRRRSLSIATSQTLSFSCASHAPFLPASFELQVAQETFWTACLLPEFHSYFQGSNLRGCFRDLSRRYMLTCCQTSPGNSTTCLQAS